MTPTETLQALIRDTERLRVLAQLSQRGTDGHSWGRSSEINAAAQRISDALLAALSAPADAPQTAESAKLDPSCSAPGGEALRKNITDMERASKQIDEAADGNTYQLGLVALALMARKFLRDYAADRSPDGR